MNGVLDFLREHGEALGVVLLGGAVTLTAKWWDVRSSRFDARATAEQAQWKAIYDYHVGLQRTVTELQNGQTELYDKLKEALDENIALRGQIGELQAQNRLQEGEIRELKQENDRLTRRVFELEHPSGARERSRP